MSPALAWKAEVVLGLQLVSRHRSPRLAVLLVLSLTALLLLEAESRPTRAAAERTVLLMAGILSAVASSRLLAQGGPVASARRVAPPWLLVPAGRLAGALLFVALPVTAAALTLLAGRWNLGEAFALAVIGALYSATTGALVMALTPWLGASAAASAGLGLALAGGVRPSQIALVFESLPVVRGAAVLAWNALPLSWRALRWIETGVSADLLLFTFWLGVGLSAAVLITTGVSQADAGSPS